MSDRAAASEEQLVYARLLAMGMYLGLGLLLLTFVIYVTGLVEAAVPISELPSYWSMNVSEYLEAINHDHLQRDHHLTGWWWVTALGFGDYMNFIGVAVLSAVTIVCFFGIVPTLLRKRDFLYATIALVQAVILAAAASGFISAGH